MLKWFAIAIALVALLALPIGAAGAGVPSGRYSTDITGGVPAQVDGHWTIGFAPKGRYSVTQNGSLAARGNDTIKGSKITFEDTGGSHSCRPADIGSYTFTLKGPSLSFHATHDACAARRAVLTTQAFHAGT